MFTIKQMEALYWVSTLGSFEAAADFLNLAQSSVSKRLGELEQQFLRAAAAPDGPQVDADVAG